MVTLWTVVWHVCDVHCSCRASLGSFCVFFFPGAAGVMLQKALLPRGGALHSISIPIRVPCWGPPVPQPCRPCLGQTEQVGMEKT